MMENTIELTTATMNPDMAFPFQSLVKVASLVDSPISAGIVANVPWHVLDLVVTRKAQPSVVRVPHGAERQHAEHQVGPVHFSSLFVAREPQHRMVALCPASHLERAPAPLENTGE